MIFVVGVHHKEVQYPNSGNERDKVERFCNFVRNFCREKNIQLIAEEWKDEVRDNSSTRRTYVEDIASELGIEYLPCEPSRPESERLGIKGRIRIAEELGTSAYLIMPGSEEERRVNELSVDDDKKREEYWLGQIANHGGTTKATLFVCGFEHPRTFIPLLKDRGHEAQRVTIE